MNQPNPDFSGCSRVDVSPVNADFEQQVAELVNQERWNNGNLPPLKRNSLLDLAARFHAKDMFYDDYFAHDSYDSNGSKVCAWSTRISNWYSGWNTLAENIAWGYGSPSAVMSGWMGSAGHRANILSTGNCEIGVGYYTGDLWVQDFGCKRTVFPLVINREAAQTSGIAVSLYLYGSGTFTQMRLRNDNDAWSAWTTFASSVNWALLPAKGMRTVTAELKKSDGTVITSSDDIYLSSGAALGGLPAEITFIFNRSQGVWLPSAFTLQPQNTGGSLSLSWTLSEALPWLDESQVAGVTPAGSSNLTISALNTSTPGLTQGTLTVTVSDPPNTSGSPQEIQIRAIVVDDLSNQVFLPLQGR